MNRSIALERVVCELCGSDRSQPVMAGPDRLLGVPGEFHVARCKDCGLVYTNPRPTEADLPLCYVGDYGVYSPAGGQAQRMALYHERLARRLNACSGNPTPPLPASGEGENLPPQAGGLRGVSDRRVLDLGCGAGMFLSVMRSLGWQAVGLEMDAGAAARAGERGLEVVNAPLADAQFAEGSFDLITMSHLLEHLPHPRQAIRQIRRWLRPGGTLFITLPDVNSWERRLFGSRWYPWDLPRHLFHFDPDTLGRLLNEEGLKVRDLRFLTGFYTPQSIRYCLQRTPPSPATPRSEDELSDPRAADSRSSGLREAFKSAVYRMLLKVASASGRVIRGEIMELTASDSK